MKKDSPKKTVSVKLQSLSLANMEVYIKGMSPLISGKQSEDSIKQMQDKQSMQAKAPKKARDPKAEFEGSLHIMPDGNGYGYPAIGFKKSCLFTAHKDMGLEKSVVKKSFQILGDDGCDLIRLNGKPQMRTDMRRLKNGSADPCYRAEFKNWSCKLNVVYDESQISAEQIINLINKAGFSSGVGAWRPSSPLSPGTFGMFQVDMTK